MSKPNQHPNSARSFRRVVPIGFVSLFTDIASEMVFAFLGVFVVGAGVLGGLGADSSLLGLMEGLAEFVMNGFRVVSGFLTDLIPRRKPLMMIGYALSAFTKPLLGAASSFADALTVRLADRAGKGIRTSPRDTLITEAVQDEHRSGAFGFHRAMDQSGAVIGPLLAFLLYPFIGYRGVFLTSIIPGIIAVTILVVFVRDTGIVGRKRVSFRKARSVFNLKLASYLAVIGMFTLGAYSFLFVQLKAADLGVEGGSIALVYATLNLATVLVATPFGILADRIGNTKVLMIAFALFFVTNLGNRAISTGVVFAFILAVGYGIFLGISDSIQRAIVPSLVPSEFRGTGYALYYLVVGGCSLVGNFVFGLLWKYNSIPSAYTYSLATSAVAIIGLGLLLHEERHADNEDEKENSAEKGEELSSGGTV